MIKIDNSEGFEDMDPEALAAEDATDAGGAAAPDVADVRCVSVGEFVRQTLSQLQQAGAEGAVSFSLVIGAQDGTPIIPEGMVIAKGSINFTAEIPTGPTVH